jgi:hydrogenase nickel incorporation protein HypB
MSDGTDTRKYSVVTSILKANDRLAAENRRRFAEAGVCAIDVIGSPGAGKTALIEETISRLTATLRIGVVTADIATSFDAERLSRFGVPTVQIQTEGFGGACHLEAGTLKQALDRISLPQTDILIIENVGNLVCPAEFDLGHTARVAVLSVTEGEEKPLKYPLAFRVSDMVVLSKIDLLPHLKFDMEAARANLRRINGTVPLAELSAQTGAGFDRWVEWVRELVEKKM